MSYYDINDMTNYIRKAATARGIDPDVALRVARSEGLGRDTWQSNIKKNGHREPSYGPFQLLVGDNNPNFPSGMGDRFVKSTGLDPSNPKNAYATVDFALDQAVNKGWGEWYGARDAGITGKYGIGPNAKPMGVSLNYTPDNPGSIRRGMLSDEMVGAPMMQPLDAPVEVASRPTFDANADKGFDLFKGMDFKAPGVMKGLEALAGAFGGGGSDSQAEAHATPIQSSLPSMEAADAQRTAAAQQLLTQLMQKRSQSRLRPPGLSLMGAA